MSPSKRCSPLQSTMSPSTLNENGAFSSESQFSYHLSRPSHHTPHRESRHPNVVLYLGLSRAPDPDGRIFIISEFIENGTHFFRYLPPLSLLPQATSANTSTTNPSRCHGVSDFPLQPTLPAHSLTFTLASASIATSKARTYSSPRMGASRSPTLALPA